VNPGSECPRFEEAISARLDGEAHPIAPEVLDAHLARCRDCRDFDRRAGDLKRRLRVRPAEPVPDLSASILLAIPSGRARKGRRRAGAERRTRLRAFRVPLAAVLTVMLVGGAAVGGELLADAGAGGRSPQDAAGSTLTSSRYPGATMLVNSVGKPNLALTDTAGQPYNVAAQTAGHVTLIYFGYTHCPDVCPINMALTAEALLRMPPQDRQAVTVVFISTDPARDTPAVIRAWLDHFDPSFVGLTGTQAEIREAERAVGMPLSYAETVATSTSGYEVVHAGYTLVYSQDGLAHLTVDGTESPAQYAATLEHLVAQDYQGA